MEIVFVVVYLVIYFIFFWVGLAIFSLQCHPNSKRIFLYPVKHHTNAETKQKTVEILILNKYKSVKETGREKKKV